VVTHRSKLLRALAWAVGGGALFVFVAGLSFYLAMKLEMRSTQVTVPDVTGLAREEAARVGEPMDLPLEVVDERHDPGVGSGRVLQQDPPPGASVRRGRRVKVVLSLGGRTLNVPSLVGHFSRAVDIELRRDGFLPGDEARAWSRTAPVGTVLAQVPAPETLTVPGARVHLLVSDGPRPARWVMPDLTGRPVSEVESWLAFAGLRRGQLRLLPATGNPAGTVIGQLPLPGHPVASRAVVDLTVAP
jgi:eukaryotic-like serine/threonine-protein kinase